jgi:hypothetical protein
LFLDPGLGDGITDCCHHTVPIGRPRDFFRAHPDQAYRRRAEIYVHKPEGQIDAQTYIIGPNMRGKILEARPCTLITTVDRFGAPRIYPVPLPREGERDNDAWISARAIVRTAMKYWVRMIWDKRAYVECKARPGYAPDPDLSKLPLFNELVRMAAGAHGMLYGEAHPIYRDLFGIPDEGAADDL